MQRLFLNGRFAHQPLTGVQRFAIGITAAIDRLISAGEWPDTTMLLPYRKHGEVEERSSRFTRLQVREVGQTRGHFWEQFALPRAARDGVLINLGNTAPILSGRRQVVVIHDAGVFDTPESYSRKFRLWYKLVQRRLAAGGAHIVTVSEFSRGRIAERLCIAPERIAVMHEGADHILATPSDTAILSRHGLKRGGFVLMVGAGTAHKNADTTAGLADTLERRGMVLAIAGSPRPSAAYQSNSSARPIGLRLGRVTDAELRALYQSAATLLFPSRYEGFGLPAVEAMICGCPVIAARSGAIAEVCGDSAIYFTTSNEREMIYQVGHLLDNPDLAASLRQRGLRRATAFSWERSARLLGDVVAQIA